MQYSDKLDKIKGIGEKTQRAFLKLGIVTLMDLLEHYPKGYDVYEKPVSIGEVLEGEVFTIEAEIAGSPKLIRARRLQIVTARARDLTGVLNLTWYNMPYLARTIKSGTVCLLRGKICRKNGVLLMEQPRIYRREEYYRLLKVLQPIYPLTEGLTNNMIVKAMRQILDGLNIVGDYIPARISGEYSLMDRREALVQIHFPKDRESMLTARKRLVFDEFFMYAIALRRLKESQLVKGSDFVMKESAECDRLIKSLPYSLTKAQEKVWREIRTDLCSGSVMNRLIQGDVGSGKTILAVLALLMAVKNGYQASIMAPTEVLAKQHYNSFTKLLEPFGISVCLLVGSMTASQKRDTYEIIRSHRADIIIGTHALIQEKVEYDNLALVVTDEQHRFGVRQREALMEKGQRPHVLVMSATPIPRTLAIILYGDLDISIVDELPAGRLPIKNCVVGTEYRPNAYRFISKQAAMGKQAYVICPMVEESEEIEAENVVEYAESLKDNLPREIKVEYLHGRMKAKEKNEIMERFANGEIQVLVSTTVVEVGVNVPNATVMMVENAERFGLAQLHQLRGRVGRGSDQSYCIFICGTDSVQAKQRLEILNKSNDGFFIAAEDLKLRGPGDVFGIRQSGDLQFKLADVFNDAGVLKQAGEAAKSLSDDEVNRIFSDNPHLEEKILQRNTGTI